MLNRRTIVSLALMSLLPLAQATSFPMRPVTLIVSTPPGGPSDLAARLIAKSMSNTFGQTVVVENRAGANGAIAAQAVMSAAPDGHTLLWCTASMAGLPYVMKSPPFRSMSELTPVANAVTMGYALFANRDLPVQNFTDLVAHGRAHPGQLNYGTGVLGEWGMALHVLQAVGVKAERVPYKGGVQLMPDLISGQLQLNFGPISSGLQHVRTGKLKMLATALPQRSAILPDVPTFTELGIPSGGLPTWNAVCAPPSTSREIAQKIASAVAAAVREPAVAGPLAQNGVETNGAGPAQLAEAVTSASKAWQDFVREHAIAQE